jgi:hypothetical protein
LVNGTIYYYVVSALNLAGESGNSAQASATPQFPPTLAISLLGTNLTLSWPGSTTDCSVFARTNLSIDKWLQLTSPASQLIDNHWQITIPMSGDAQFFQLQQRQRFVPGDACRDRGRSNRPRQKCRARGLRSQGQDGHPARRGVAEGHHCLDQDQGSNISRIGLPG